MRTEIKKALQPWAQPYHFGKNQQAVHVCMGLILKKNIPTETSFRTNRHGRMYVYAGSALWSFLGYPSPLQCSVVPVLAAQLSLRCA